MKQFVVDGRNLLERFMESIGQVVEKVRNGPSSVGFGASETVLLFQYTTKKYYEIPQKHIENTEHMCQTINSVLKNRRIYIMGNYMEDWIGIEAAASYLDVTKDTIRIGSRRLIFRHIKQVNYGNLKELNQMLG